MPRPCVARTTSPSRRWMAMSSTGTGGRFSLNCAQLAPPSSDTYSPASVPRKSRRGLTRPSRTTCAKPLTSDVKGFAQVVREDLVSPRLLFLGTEAGLYVSLDGGASWAQFKENLPPVPVDDIAIHRREGDVVLATHGRGIYIIDDLAPLRALTPEVLNKDVAMLPSRPSPLT